MSVQGRLGGDPLSHEDVALLALLGRHVEKALRAPSTLHPAKESPCNETSPQRLEANEGGTAAATVAQLMVEGRCYCDTGCREYCPNCNTEIDKSPGLSLLCGANIQWGGE
jgi:hypothetical protein